MRVIGAVLASVLLIGATIGALAPTARATAESCGNGWTDVYDQTNLNGTMKEFCWGTNSSNLGSIGWDNRIRSLQQQPGGGHGFIYWTGPDYTDSSWKVCGNTVRLTMPTGFDRTITSYQSTSSCPS